MKPCVVCALVLAMLPGFAVATPPGIAWEVRYDGQGNGNDQATDMVVDDEGNTYVTGYSSGLQWDIATVKYGPDGQQLATARFASATGGDDVPWGIAVDALGAVYVVGFSTPVTFDNHDIVVLKYDASLHQQWVRTHSGQPNVGLDEAYDVTTDASGNVYVTGSEWYGDTDSDMAVLKYAPGGTLTWARRFDGAGHTGDSANAIGVDAAGNVHVTGITQHDPGYGNMDLTTVTFDSAGVELWSDAINGSANSNDVGIALDLDDAGNLYVAGAIASAGNAGDVATIKYDAAGGRQWLQTFQNRDFDAALDVVARPMGGAFAVGYLSNRVGGLQTDYATFAYDDAGDLLWTRTYDGPTSGYDEAQSVAIDGDGNVYVTGYSDGGTDLVDYDYATVKYDASGTEQWATRYDGPGSNIDVAVKVAVDPGADVIVGGWSTGSHAPDVEYTTVKYDQASSTATPGGTLDARGLRVAPCAPNPCNPTTTIAFEVADAVAVRIGVYDVAGRRVRALASGRVDAGRHELTWDGRDDRGNDLPSGTYVLRLEAGGNVQSRRVSLVR